MYNKEQERWNAILKTHWWGRGHYSIVKELITDYLRSRNNLRSLDMGCSGGIMMDFLKQFGKVYGLDISFDGLSYCQDQKVVVQADAVKVPFIRESFDLITILDVVEHVDDDNALFEEAYRVAKKGAIVFVNVPAFSFFWRSHDVRYGHKRRYSRSKIEELAKRHFFTVEKIVYLHAHFAVPLFLSMLIDKFLIKDLGKRDDFISLGPVGDRFLLGTLLLERRLMRYGTFPFGISLFCVLRK